MTTRFIALLVANNILLFAFPEISWRHFWFEGIWIIQYRARTICLWAHNISFTLSPLLLHPAISLQVVQPFQASEKKTNEGAPSFNNARFGYNWTKDEIYFLHWKQRWWDSQATWRKMLVLLAHSSWIYFLNISGMSNWSLQKWQQEFEFMWWMMK